jgi:hypothetical protein
MPALPKVLDLSSGQALADPRAMRATLTKTADIAEQPHDNEGDAEPLRRGLRGRRGAGGAGARGEAKAGGVFAALDVDDAIAGLPTSIAETEEARDYLASAATLTLAIARAALRASAAASLNAAKTAPALAETAVRLWRTASARIQRRGLSIFCLACLWRAFLLWRATLQRPSAARCLKPAARRAGAGMNAPPDVRSHSSLSDGARFGHSARKICINVG